MRSARAETEQKYILLSHIYNRTTKGYKGSTALNEGEVHDEPLYSGSPKVNKLPVVPSPCTFIESASLIVSVFSLTTELLLLSPKQGIFLGMDGQFECGNKGNTFIQVPKITGSDLIFPEYNVLDTLYT